MIELFDTHCHIQESQVTKTDQDATLDRWAKIGNPSPKELIDEAQEDNVTRLMCVGCSTEDSERAATLAAQYDSVWASIGIHPHEAKIHLESPELLDRFRALATLPKVRAVGECGLDYFYEHSPREDQMEILHFQLKLAQEHNLPMIFHVREAFADFWPIFDQYPGVRGVVHSFTGTKEELQQILARDLYVGLNGIMTFTKDPAQLEVAKAVPQGSLVLETDAPFLTPAPYRGTICRPKHVRVTAEFLANLRGETLESLAETTTRNARKLFEV